MKWDGLLAALVACTVGGLVASLTSPVVVVMARALQALDHPGGRKQHETPVPRVGGVAIVAGGAAGVATALMAFWQTLGVGVDSLLLASLAVASAMVFLVGLVDDLHRAPIVIRVLVEVTAAWLVVSAGAGFRRFGLPFLGDVDLGAAGPLVSIAWIVVLTNAVNLLDGLDGLAAGVVAIIAACMMVYGVFLESFLAVVILASVLGACLGFLRHNWSPARIFMGDSGALTLGFLLAASSVISAQKASAAVAILVPILAMGVPVIDAMLVMAWRFSSGEKAGPRERVARVFRADRQHLHHLLEAVSPQRQRIVRWVYLMVLASCAMALAVAVTKDQRVGWSLVVVETVVIVAVRRLGWARTVRRLRPDA